MQVSILAGPGEILTAEEIRMTITNRRHGKRSCKDFLAFRRNRDFGLIFYRRILEQVRTCLAASGNLIVEVGFDQAEDVKSIAKEMSLSYVRSRSDLSEIERVLVFES